MSIAPLTPQNPFAKECKFKMESYSVSHNSSFCLSLQHSSLDGEPTISIANKDEIIMGKTTELYVEKKITKKKTEGKILKLLESLNRKGNMPMDKQIAAKVIQRWVRVRLAHLRGTSLLRSQRGSLYCCPPQQMNFVKILKPVLAINEQIQPPQSLIH